MTILYIGKAHQESTGNPAWNFRRMDQDFRKKGRMIRKKMEGGSRV